MQSNINNKEKEDKIINESNEELNEKLFFHLFRVHINDFWNYFMEPSFIPTYFYDHCKIINIKNFDKVLKENDILEVFYPDKNVKIKILIKDIVDTPNYKSFSYNIIDCPENLFPFTVLFSFYFCSYTYLTGLKMRVTAENITKKNFIIDYVSDNEQIIYKNIEKYIEINFKGVEEIQSIEINKSDDDVLDFLTKNNYSNLSLLLGNNAVVKPTQNANEVEIEDFTKNNITKLKINKNIDTCEKELILQFLENKIQIPRQLVIIKIISIKKTSSLIIFTHKIKQYLANDLIKNYSILKQKILWLLKSTIEKEKTN